MASGLPIRETGPITNRKPRNRSRPARIYSGNDTHTRVYARALSQSLDPRLSAPHNYQGRPSPRQFVKAVIIPADLWHCIHIGRCLPPDQITSPGRSSRSAGARSLFWVPSPDPMKTIHFESAAHYHRLGFDARLKLKRIDTRMDTLIHRAVYKYSPSFLCRIFFLARDARTGGDGTFSPVRPLYCVTHTRERNCRAVIYTTDPRYIAIRHSRL